MEQVSFDLIKHLTYLLIPHHNVLSILTRWFTPEFSCTSHSS